MEITLNSFFSTFILIINDAILNYNKRKMLKQYVSDHFMFILHYQNEIIAWVLIETFLFLYLQNNFFA